eukprot:Skav209657  [mRNA]  locus=scaffold2126:100318:102479:+ [translate_table: standard]
MCVPEMGVTEWLVSRDGFSEDARLFHTLEIIGMLASYRVLLSKLHIMKASHARLGLLAMLAAACGIWSNWRKVRRKNCGTKTFVVAGQNPKAIQN